MRYMPRVLPFLLALLLVSCGGVGGGGSAVGSGSTGGGGGGGGGDPTSSGGVPTAGMRVEDSDPNVTFTGTWTKADSTKGWSGGSAMQANTSGATVSITFVGTSIRWIGSRGRAMGLAQISVDSGPVRTVDLFARPSDEIHTPIYTVYDLGPGQHKLTITVTG